MNWKGGKFDNKGDGFIFTTGVHHVTLTQDYSDAGSFYAPTLLMLEGRHLKFMNGNRLHIRNALINSDMQITIEDLVEFNIYGPRYYAQLNSRGSITYKGKTKQNSRAFFPLEDYNKHPLQGKTIQSLVVTELELKNEVETISETLAARFNPGLGFSFTIKNNLNYSGSVKLENGTIPICVAGNINSTDGRIQSGAFKGHGVTVQANKAFLDNTTVKSAFDKISFIVKEEAKLKKSAFEAGLGVHVSSPLFTIEKSFLGSSSGPISLDATSAHIDSSTVSGNTQTLLLFEKLFASNSTFQTLFGDTVLQGQGLSLQSITFDSLKNWVHAQSKLVMETVSAKGKENFFQAEDIVAINTSLKGVTQFKADHDLTVNSLRSNAPLVLESGNKTLIDGTVQSSKLKAHARHITNLADLKTTGSMFFVAEVLDQNKTVKSGKNVVIQVDKLNDHSKSTTEAAKTLTLIYEKGKEFNGTLKGDSVVIKMDDLKLTMLRKIIANVTQLHLNSDVTIDEDLVLNTTLHLWANKLANKAKLMVNGDFIAQIQTDILQNGEMEVKGTGGLTAGNNITSHQGSTSAEALYLYAKEGDISLYQAILKAVTDVKMYATGGNIKKIGSKVDAGNDVELYAAKNIEAKSIADRQGSGQNFQDQKIEDQIEAGNNLVMKAGMNIEMTSVTHKAKNKITYDADGHIIDKALALTSESSSGGGKNKSHDTEVHQEVSKHKAGGNFVSIAGGSQALQAPEISGKRIVVQAKDNVEASDVHDTHAHESQHKSDGGLFGEKRKGKKSSYSAISKGAKFDASESLEVTAGNDLSLTNIICQAPKVKLSAIAGTLKILLGTNYSSSSSMEKSSDMLWNKQTTNVEEYKTFEASTFSDSLEINAKEALLQSTHGQTLSFAKQIEDQGIKVIYEFFDEVNRKESKTVEGPSAALAAVVVLAVTICTAGTGTAAAVGGAVASAASATGAAATIITTMTAAAFTSLCSQAALALVSSKGDIGKAAELLACNNTLKNMGISMLTAGVTSGLSEALGIPQTAVDTVSVMDHIEKQALQVGVSTSMNIALGQKPSDCLVQGLKSVAAGVIGGVCANKISAAYGSNKVDFIGHKFLHALVGGTTGALLSDDPLEGLKSGAFGAVTAELVGELVLMNTHKIANDVANKLRDAGTPLIHENIQKAIRDELSQKMDFVKLITSGISLITGQDVSVANYTASNAVENNLSKMVSKITERDVYDILQSAMHKRPPTLIDSSFPLNDAERFQSLQVSTLYKRDPDVSISV